MQRLLQFKQSARSLRYCQRQRVLMGFAGAERQLHGNDKRFKHQPDIQIQFNGSESEAGIGHNGFGVCRRRRDGYNGAIAQMEGSFPVLIIKNNK